ncbi:MAG: NAD-dependent epimerase/dehydratase family protein [Blastococcus sp.]|jgi:UDP-glucose 4-epimerase
MTNERPVRVALTVGAGFIGSHVTTALASAGHRVLVIDDLSAGTAANLAAVSGGVDLVQADVAGARQLA